MAYPGYPGGPGYPGAYPPGYPGMPGMAPGYPPGTAVPVTGVPTKAQLKAQKKMNKHAAKYGTQPRTFCTVYSFSCLPDSVGYFD
jgi:hypothetical protein